MADRRTFLKNLCGAAAGATSVGAFSLSSLEAFAQNAPRSGKRPNIVCFVGEGVRSDEFSCMGNKILKTPNMDRIANEGCAFKNSFVVNALCLPSRATMLTGLYSHTTGAVSNVQGKLPDNVVNIADLLHDAGYETAFLGKSHIQGALMDHYWDYYFGFVGQADYYRPVITEGRKGKYTPAKMYEGVYVDTLLTQKAVEWLEEEHEKPVCLFLWFYAPHAPFYRPKDMVNLYNGVPIPVPKSFHEDETKYAGKPEALLTADNKVGYSEVSTDDPRSLEELVKDHYAGVADNDRNVGAVLKVLENKKMMDDTAIILSSDHGFFLGEHHFYDKRLMYEESIRVPFFIRYPGHIKAHTLRDEMVLNLDMAPTLLDIAGIDIPSAMQGHSLMPLAEGKHVPWREDWLYEYYEYPGFENVKPCRGVRTAKYKYIHFFTEPQGYELYDLVADPEEMHNLYGKSGYEKVQADMVARLERLRRETNDTFPYTPSGLPLRPEWTDMSASHVK